MGTVSVGAAQQPAINEMTSSSGVDQPVNVNLLGLAAVSTQMNMTNSQLNSNRKAIQELQDAVNKIIATLKAVSITASAIAIVFIGIKLYNHFNAQAVQTAIPEMTHGYEEN